MNHPNKLIFSISIFVLICIHIPALSQEASTKYGKIDEDVLKMKIYSKDSSADAVILYDYGRSYFQVNDKSDGFQIVFERQTRIKIFNKNAYEYANIEIPLYSGYDNTEKLNSLKAVTYNLEGGEIVKNKMSDDAVFTENVNEHLINKKFTLPNVKEGSVIEYKYTIISDFIFNLRNWQFQYNIPVVWSEYEGLIPEYYNFKKTFTGYLSFFSNETNSKEETFDVKYSTIPGEGGYIERGIYTLKSKSTCYHYAAKDIPAFKKEPFMNSSKNYLLSVNFELATSKFPGELVKVYSTTWESINKELLDANNFGKQISSKAHFLDETATKIIRENNTPEKQMVAAVEYIKHWFKSNDRFSIYSTDNLEKVYLKKTGSIADINLTLILLLKKLNIDVEPVALSSRNNGIISPSQPNISDLNYIIAAATISGKTYLLDASEPLCPAGLIPTCCLNGNGRIIDKINSGWISLDSTATYNETVMVDLKFNDNEELTGNIQCLLKDYAALSFRKNLQDETNENEYIKKIQKDENDIIINTHSFENVDSIYKPVKAQYSISTNIKKADMIYLNPIIFERFKENLFKQEKRTYPIDFIYKTNQTYILNFTIPENYSLIETPENAAFILPDTSASFVYTVKTIGNLAQVIYKLKIDRKIFVTDEYNSLKEFFGKILAKENEQLVLKKN